MVTVPIQITSPEMYTNLLLFSVDPNDIVQQESDQVLALLGAIISHYWLSKKVYIHACNHMIQVVGITCFYFQLPNH